MSDLKIRVKEIIDTTLYGNIATVSSDSKPWNTPVYLVHDNAYCFYWSSWVDAEHSKNIRDNTNIFITIYDSTRVRGNNHQRGVYVQAVAIELQDLDEILEALKYFKGIGNKELDAADFQKDKVKRLYRAIPKKIWLNDLAESQVTKETIKMRVEVPLQSIL